MPETTSDLRERLAEMFPCTCDEAYTARGLTAHDCVWHRVVPEFLEIRDAEVERLRAELAAARARCEEAARNLREAERRAALERTDDHA